MPVCPRREKTARALTRRPFHYADVLMGASVFQTCHLSVTDDVVPATVLLFSAALITVCFVVLLLMPFPGVPQAGRAVVNGASGAVSALAGFHP